jgi:hypothetical protein
MLGGCGDDDGPVGPGEDFTRFVPPRDTPQNALSFLDVAYETRDSVRIATIYDSTYTGTSTNLVDNVTTDLTYEDEIRHVAALARIPGVRVTFDMGPQVTWERRASDDPSHPEWATIQISGYSYQIRIDDQAESIQAQGEPGSFQEFTFAPSVDSTSATDTLWSIVRWREVGNAFP